MKKFSFGLLLISILISVYTIGQTVDNTLPMYGEARKNKGYLKADEEFKQQALTQFGSVDSASKVYLQFAWGYFFRNELTSSMKRFNQVWLLNPDLPDPYFGFAALMEIREDTAAANRLYRMGREKDTDHTKEKICYERIAECKEQIEDYIGTINAYEKLVELDSTEVFYYKKLGYFHMHYNHPKEAMAAIDRALELDPKDAMTYMNKGYQYYLLKDYPQALVYYEKALTLDSTNIYVYVNRGFAEMDMQDFVAAKADFEKCVELRPNEGELRKHLGNAKLKLNDIDGACHEFTLAQKLGDEDVPKLIKQHCH